MRFGALLPQGWRLDLSGLPVDGHWAAMSEMALDLESAGFETLFVNDHFHTVPAPTSEVTYEAWSLLAAVATVTRKIRLGQMCTAVGYRNPAYLAKVVASVDVISGGRVEMGIGAGWYEHEYHGYGYEFPSGANRIGQLREAVTIMRRLWSEPSVDHHGEHYELNGAICSPQGIQDHIPVWIAGGGEKKTLAVAAELADYTNFGRDLEEFTRKDRVLRAHCETLGRDPAEITRSSNFFVFCGATKEQAEEKRQASLARIMAACGIGVENQMVRGWHSLAGAPDEIGNHLREWEEAGLQYAVMSFPDLAYDRSSMELFSTEVMPRLGAVR